MKRHLDKSAILMKDLPSIPEVTKRIIEVASDLDACVDKLEETIMEDQALASKLLRMVNSSFYGLSRKVQTISQAIVILGFNAVRELALSLFVFENQGRELAKSLWAHSVLTASVCRTLAKELRFPKVEEAFVGGLLHDIGRVIMLKTDPEEYEKMVSRTVKEKDSLLKMEREVFGCGHDQLGGFLAEKWSFPPELVTVLRDHHKAAPLSPQKNPKEVTELDVVKFSNQIANLKGIHIENHIVFCEEDFSEGEKLGLNELDLNRLFKEIESDAKKGCELFEIPWQEKWSSPKNLPSLFIISSNEKESKKLQVLCAGLGFKDCKQGFSREMSDPEREERIVLIDVRGKSEIDSVCQAIKDKKVFLVDEQSSSLVPQGAGKIAFPLSFESVRDLLQSSFLISSEVFDPVVQEPLAEGL